MAKRMWACKFPNGRLGVPRETRADIHRIVGLYGGRIAVRVIVDGDKITEEKSA